MKPKPKKTAVAFQSFKALARSGTVKPPPGAIPPITFTTPPPPKVEAPPAPAAPDGSMLNGKEIIAVAGQTHRPRYTGYLGDCRFHRCRCGLLIVESPTRELWWVPVNGGVRKVERLEHLAHVLTTACWERLQAQAGEQPLDIKERRLA